MAPKAKRSASPPPKAKAEPKAKATAPKAKAPASPKAKAKAAVEEEKPEVKKEAPPEESKDQELKYEGNTLEVKEVHRHFIALDTPGVQELGKSTNENDQLAARVLMAYVGDKDTSWKNTQASLATGYDFIKECLEIDGINYVTRKTLEAMEGVGKLKPGENYSCRAGFVIACYMDAVIFESRENFGMNKKVVEAPKEDEKPPEWPVTIPFKELPNASNEARKWRKTALFLCSGKAQTVDTYFSYADCSCLLDAKWMLNKVDIKKTDTVEQIREEIRVRIVKALQNGLPIHICMSNSAVRMKTKYCSSDTYPQELFKNDLWLKEEVYGKVVREADLRSWTGAFPGKMKDEESYAFITSDFTLESAKEYLPEALPYFDDMAIYVIDPTTIDDGL